MRHIYVDYSCKETRTLGNGKKQLMKDKHRRGGIGIVVVEDGRVLLAEKVMCKGIKEGEKLAFLYGMKYLRNGDTICTDQNSFPIQLSKYGEVASKSKNKTTQALNHKINNVLSLKKGVTVQEVASHKGDKWHNLADKLSKIASGMKGNTLNIFLEDQGISMTRAKLKDKLINTLYNQNKLV